MEPGGVGGGGWGGKRAVGRGIVPPPYILSDLEGKPVPSINIVSKFIWSERAIIIWKNLSPPNFKTFLRLWNVVQRHVERECVQFFSHCFSHTEEIKDIWLKQVWFEKPIRDDAISMLSYFALYWTKDFSVLLTIIYSEKFTKILKVFFWNYQLLKAFSEQIWSNLIISWIPWDI